MSLAPSKAKPAVSTAQGGGGGSEGEPKRTMCCLQRCKKIHFCLTELLPNELYHVRVKSSWPGLSPCLDSMSASWFIQPGIYTALSESKFACAQRRMQRASLDSRRDRSPPWWFMYKTCRQAHDGLEVLWESVSQHETLPKSPGNSCANLYDGLPTFHRLSFDPFGLIWP